MKNYSIVFLVFVVVLFFILVLRIDAERQELISDLAHCKATNDAIRVDVENRGEIAQFWADVTNTYRAELKNCNEWLDHYIESESWYRHGYICLADKECYACVDATGWNSDTITIDIETCGNDIFGQMFGTMRSE